MAGCRCAAARAGGSRRSTCSGCVFFGVSADAGYVVPASGSLLDQAAANWNTSLGAACFLACVLDTLYTDRAAKLPIRGWVRDVEHRVERDVRRAI